MQYNTGAAAFTSGSSTVTGLGTAWLSDPTVQAGSAIVRGGDAVSYTIAAIQSDTTLSLTAPYAGVSATAAPYVIHTDFTANLGLPLFSDNDAETAALLNEGLGDLDNAAGGLDGRVSAIESVNTVQDGRLDGIDTQLTLRPSGNYSGTLSGNRYTATGLPDVHGLTAVVNFQSSNSGAVTLNGRPLLTVTGLALPAGYIRQNQVTRVTRWGSGWIADRLPERGSNANGSYVRYADGRVVAPLTSQISAQALNAGNGFYSEVRRFVFPILMSEMPIVTATADYFNGVFGIGVQVVTTTTSYVDITTTSPVSTTTIVEIRALVNGYWY